MKEEKSETDTTMGVEYLMTTDDNIHGHIRGHSQL